MPIAAAAVRGSSAHQLARQPKATVSRPPSSGPARLDMPALAPQIPSALPRRSGGKPDTAPASAAGLTRPAPAPWMTRAMSSASKLWASAPASAPTANTPRPLRASRRAPNRSTSSPAGKEHQRVGAEVGAQHGRGRAALDVEAVSHRRQRHRDQRSVELEECRGGRAGRQPRPRRARDRRLGRCRLHGARRNGRIGHVLQYHGSGSRHAAPYMKLL